jgi:hypothetical protein
VHEGKTQKPRAIMEKLYKNPTSMPTLYTRRLL